MINHIKNYYKSVCEAYKGGNTESSFNPPIIALLSEFGARARDKSGERAGQTGENVDLKLWRVDDNITETEPFAGVEVKKVGGIDKRAREQIKTLAKRYENMILTDNLVWQFWHADDDKMYAGVELIKLVDGELILNSDLAPLFISLVKDFLLRDPGQIRSSNKLAEYMAIHANTIRDVITGILKKDDDEQPLVDDKQKNLPMFSELYGLYRKIKEELRPLLNTSTFADMYAQTIVYGLFIARYNDKTPQDFNRFEAIGNLQEESPLLNRFFTHIASSGKTHPTLDSVIDKLCALYKTCDIAGLLDKDERRDTIVHFYEDFLTHYDPVLKKELGVFYTPYQVVQYMISFVDKILVEDFNISGGLSNNERIQISVPSEEYQVSSRSKKTQNTQEVSVPRVAILEIIVSRLIQFKERSKAA